MEYKDFYQLQIWRDGYDLLMNVYTCTNEFPVHEQYALIAQVCRSANSIIANIAESHGRYSYADKIRVLYIARGEIFETRSHISVAYGRRYVSLEMFTQLNAGYKKLIKDINSYIKSLQSKK